MKTMILAAIMVAAFSARAQQGAGIHVAPGMMVHLPKKARAKEAKPVDLGPPVAILPRFWHSSNAESKATGLAQLFYFIRYNTRYPEPARAVEFEGRVYVRAVINAAGEPESIEIVNRHEPVQGQKDAAAAIEAESIRVVRLMKFQPGTEATESLIIPMLYQLP